MSSSQLKEECFEGKEKLNVIVGGKYESMFIYHFGPRDDNFKQSKEYKKEKEDFIFGVFK